METRITESPPSLRAPRFYGRRARELETSTFLLAESTYDGRAALPLHSHANAHFCLVLSGSYTERLDDGEVERRPGDLIFYRAGVGHAERHHAPGRHFMIEIDSALTPGAEGGASWISVPDACRALATRVFAEFRREERVPAARLAPLIGQLIDQTASQARSTPGPPWLRDVESRLRELGDGAPSLERLATEAGVHPVHLGRVFRRIHGCTPGEFLRRLRVERAQRALAVPDAELADVAQASGFCDQSHLNRVFKRHNGLTPGRFRGLAAAPTR